MFLTILLAYQLEQYDNIRFLKFIYRKPIFWIKWSQRQKINWTVKLAIIFFISVCFFIWLNFFFLYLDSLYLLFSVILTIFLYPFIIIFANSIIYPIDYLTKNFIIYKAKLKLKKFPKTMIIAITWSYWKTSTKEYLKTILSTSFNVIATPWTHNTQLWISNFILKDLNEKTDILILEMWAYKVGDIQKLCNIAKPDIWVITWITLQHLEKFGNINNIIKAKFELAQNVIKWWVFIFDECNENILSWLKLYEEKLRNIEKIWIWKIDVNYIKNLWGIKFEFENTYYKSKLLWSHNAKNLSISIKVAKRLWVDENIIQQTIYNNIDFVPHRLQLIKNHNWIYIIDDSFNWNIEWVKSTLDLLKITTIEWKKIYLTPGLVELWEISKEIHLEIWKLLVDSVDKVLLINNSSTEYIKQWLLKNGFDINNINQYKTASQAHEDLKNILTNWDLIIFQNDWTDNYI